MAITPFPPAPLVADDTPTFNFKAFAWALAIDGFVDEVNAVIPHIDDAITAGNAVVAATQFKGDWSSLSGPLSIPATVYHSGVVWMLLQNVSNVAAEVPGVSSKWVIVSYYPSPTFTNLAFTGTLTGGTGIINIGSGQFYKDATGKIGIGTATPAAKLTINGDTTALAGHNFTWYNAANSNYWQMYHGTSDVFFLNYNGAEYMRFANNGNVAIGTTATAGAKFTVGGDAKVLDGAWRMGKTGYADSWWINGGGSTYLYYSSAPIGGFDNSTGAYTALSDERLKKDIADCPYGLDAILALRPVAYRMKSQADDAPLSLGFLAQEARIAIPPSVTEMVDGILGMDKEQLIPALVNAIKELASRIQSLESA